MVGRQQNLSPMWKKLTKLDDLGIPTSFLDHVYLGRTQRDSKTNKNTTEERCSNREFLLEQLKNYLGGRSHANTIAWSYDMEGHAKKYVERYCELANKTQSSKTKSLLHAWTTNAHKLC